ncbi:outer membrane protein [Alkalilacustris brevis]|uniref:outer membrane protein n=1 Tax=Alkalilacustris brevis TaxID=2026338 RepID=UPI000E0D4BD7|nr:porin family protein [Alkalilacustris brevis]
MRKHLILALAAGLAAPVAANAGALEPAPEPVVTPAPSAGAPASYNWTGPYAGVTVGVGRVTFSDRPNESGVGAGFHLGMNHDMGDWVIGGEVDFAPSALVDLSSGNQDLKEAGRLKLRAGPKLGIDGRTFAFGTLGAAHVRTSGAGGSHSDTGWLAGVGVSHALDPQWVVTGELVHHRFRNVAGTSNTVNATSASAGVSFRF